MADSERKAYDVDRPRGILSTEDRKFLLGQTEYTSSSGARRRRQKIRERVTNAMLDFRILQELEARDRNQIFEGEERRDLLAGGFSSGYFFLYDALARSRKDTEHIDLNLTAYLSQAIEHVEKTRGHRATLSMEIHREELSDPEEIFERVKEHGFQSLNAAELDTVWFSDEVDAAAFASFLNQVFEDDAEKIRAIDIEKERDWYNKLNDEA
ncbi:hypothetical protein [Haloarcula amylolytica]|uniref:Domain of unknown function domain-containing protein n=1 Tax=Haloarcula amylolytica JCM 13557 TaxID=1227452 RepID=M0KF31_9EURY|nr:hypothetical protein [Haloarcula amylolytica]EMA18435.1 hypothetical protein C442_14240 [Haloarcula amylolytica JCM 13557]